MRRCPGRVFKKRKEVTSDDADAKVEKNDGVPEGRGHDGQSAHESPCNDHRAAAVAVDQHAADGPCKQERERRRGQSGETVIRPTVGAAVSLRLFDSAHLRHLSHQGQRARWRRRSLALAAPVTHYALAVIMSNTALGDQSTIKQPFYMLSLRYALVTLPELVTLQRRVTVFFFLSVLT